MPFLYRGLLWKKEANGFEAVCFLGGYNVGTDKEVFSCFNNFENPVYGYLLIMNIEQVREYCLSLPGATEDMAFGPDTLLFRLCGKIFACIDLNRPDRVVFRSDEENTVILREEYAGIIPAWHWNKRYWSEVLFDIDVPDSRVLQLLCTSYEGIRRELPAHTLYNFAPLPEDWAHEHLPEVDSLMNALHWPEMKARKEKILLVTTDFQTAGRGQGTNTWESEAGKNLLFAVRFFPEKIPARQQFLLLQVLSLAVAEAAEKACGKHILVKWPNDIYCGDRKLSGMLTECDIAGGYVSECRCGIGMNINQELFVSNAPNPVSLKQLAGKSVNRAVVLRNFIKSFVRGLKLLGSENEGKLNLEYLRRQYRLEGWHLYRDSQGLFEAELAGIREDGCMMLQDRNGSIRVYAHKEVSFVLPENLA